MKQLEWRESISLDNPDDIDYLYKWAQQAEQRIKELETMLDAWYSVFGTSQLSHASARLQAAERNAEQLAAPSPAPGTSALAGWCEGCEHDAPRFKLLCNECTRKHREPVTDKYIAALAEGKKGE